MKNGTRKSPQTTVARRSAGESGDGTATTGTRRGRSGAWLRPTLFACGLLLLSGLAYAEEKETDDTGTQVALADTANKDLLLFWEEKELYVQTATRTAKPISQVAENMEVVTAKDIQDMNAHNLVEVLRRVPGVLVDTGAQDFDETSSLHIQGSAERHVTVLLDGIAFNLLGGNNALVNTIPVQIIDRIEIIKGAASSSWGSGMGGVINIITKNTGDTARPKGTVSASYGEGNSGDYRAEAYGKGGPVGYYLYAGRQASDGLRNKQASQNNNYYAKLSGSPVHNLDLLFTVGGSTPHIDQGVATVNVSPLLLVRAGGTDNTFFANGAFDYRISPEWSLKGAGYTFDQHADSPSYTVPAYTIRKHYVFDDRTVGGNLKLVYASGMHTAVVGSDISFGDMDQFSQSKTVVGTTSPSISKWALFANDTLVFDKLAVTPGVRLDHNSLSGSFISPSVGATYELDEHTIARVSAARGFTSPGLSFISGGGILSAPNPNLTAEYGWSYQAGLESAVMDYFNLKGNVFRHDISHEISLMASSTPGALGTYMNMGSITRQGYELGAESAPVYNTSLRAAYSYVQIDADSQKTDNYSYQIGIKYDDRESIIAQLAGTYVWWNIGTGKYDDFIWDLNLTKKFHVSETTNIDVFVNVHNLFSGLQYTTAAYPTPPRWAEGGLRYNF